MMFERKGEFMKKVTNFIVNKRYLILSIFIILSILALYLGTKVNINYDISAYLPNTSETKIGMNIMNDNFEEIKSSSLNVMFKDLKDDEKNNLKQKLEGINGVDSVSYENTDDYNNEEYTLYIVNVADTSDSKVAKDVYNKINDEFKDYHMSLSGSIDKSNKPVLHFWIVIVAVVFAMIILIIMCDSYVEPFLFLFVILLAVAMNKGTNIIFNNVSHITNAISAILQMALSMDYSIMLMNRYTQERETEKDKEKAMKNALYNAFKSISSSSVTTIVGLLALVFMSFTIGRDLGFVLAKGVLFSLLSIFLCLPALILIFDKLIVKTRKKSFNLKLNTLGKLSYKLRYPLLIIFLILFVGSFFLKNGLGILYTDVETDEIAKHFKENNQMAVIYSNKYDEDVSKYCQNLKGDKISEVLCYGNTINQKLKVDELPIKLQSLGSNTIIDDYLLRILYYNYYNKENNIKMSFSEFVSFIEENIYHNEKFNSQITDDMKTSLSKLNYFIYLDSINKPRISSDISNILGINEETVKSLYILYNADYVNTSMKINDFVNFLKNNVLTNDTYASLISNEQKITLEKIVPFMNKNTINSKLNAKELSNLFGIDIESINKLLLLYYMNTGTNQTLSLSELIMQTSFISENTSYLDGIDVSKITSLKSIVMNENNINSLSLNKMYLSKYFENIDNTLVDTIYNLAMLPDTYEFTPSDFITFTLTNMDSSLPNEVKANLSLLKLVIDDTLTNEKTKYTEEEMANLLNQSKESMNKLYALILFSNGYEYKLSPISFVNLILDNKDNELLKSKLDSNTLKSLNLVKIVMDSVNNDKYYSITEMSNLLNTDIDNIKLVYSLYEINVLNKNVTISLNNFTSFLLNKVVTNPTYSSNFDNNSISNLKVVRTIMNGTLNGLTYDYNEIYNLLSKLSNNLDKNLVELIYLYYGSTKYYDNSYTLTVEQFANYLYNDILNDNRFSKFIDEEMQKNIKDSKKTVDDAKKLLVSDNYSRMIINTTYELEGKETFDFVQSIKDNLKSEDKEIYVIGDSPMAYDINNSFGSELDFITILTMVAIFVVVAITFKSVIISLILVLIIQCAVFVTMGILSLTGSSVYFIALLIVQSILMGATIDYAIVFTSYYKESRQTMDIIDSLKNSYNKSIHTILTSASILIIVTLIVGSFASAIASKICMTLSEGTICSLILILFVLPGILAVFDKIICKNGYKEIKKQVK